MEKEFIHYEQALALKELGFNEPCLAYFYTYDDENLLSYDLKILNDNLKAPLYQQCFRWFREKYNLYSTIALISNSNTERAYMVMIDYIYPHKAILDYEEFSTPEEAELECLKKLIEIVKNK